jgi:hypothetical protein
LEEKMILWKFFFLLHPQTEKKKAKKGRSFFLKGFTVVFHQKIKNLKNIKNK